MRNFLKFFVVLAFVNFVFAAPIVDELTLLKIKKLVQKEEDIAKAYKEYPLKNGKVPVDTNNKPSIKVLIDNGFLPKGFDTINPFGKEIILESNNFIKKFDTNDTNLKMALKEYYLKSKNREFTNPLKDNIEIKLNNKESFIFKNQALITKTKANGKFLLDDKGVLNYYKTDGNLGYSFDKEIVLSKDVHIYDKTTNKYNETWADGLSLTSEILRLGTSIFDSNRDNNSKEYIVVGPGKIAEINKDEKEYGKTIIQFNRRAGGMIVNGDIYTWGNNGNAIAGIDAKKTLSGSSDKSYQLFTSIVPFRAKIYDTKTYEAVTNNNVNKEKCLTPIGSGSIPCRYTNTNCSNPTGSGSILCMDTLAGQYYSENYFSSSKRPKFIDFFSSVYVGTCTVSIEGALYCSGATANDASAFKMYNDISKDSEEILYMSKKFDGNTFKAKKIFANNSIWHILGQDGLIYVWGTDGSGFGGQGKNLIGKPTTGTLTYSTVKNTTNIIDITYITYIGKRRLGALDNKGNIFIWGTEGLYSCNIKWKDSSNNDVTYDLCSPIKITLDSATIAHFGDNKGLPNFVSLKGGIDGFIAKDINNNFYRVRQEDSNKIKVEDVRTLIKNWKHNDNWKYIEDDDKNIISADLARTITDSTYYGNGIVWVNGKNELKGDIFIDNTQKSDALFVDSIKKIKWKQIKVIDENNGMCGIDTNNQMYCWGEQAYYRPDSSGSTKQLGTTYMIPIFNTNLYALDKDFMVGEVSSSYELTKIGYTNWQPTSGKSFNMKYPTYIGGFNYEFEFK